MPTLKIPEIYNPIKRLQAGGMMGLTDEKKQELFPYFAYIYSQQLNPDKYGSVESIEDWFNLIQENKEDMDAIVKAAADLSDEDWESIGAQYNEAQKSEQTQEAQFAAKGAKLKVLKAQSGMKMINPAMKNNPEYLRQRQWDSTYHADNGIKRDLKIISRENTFTNPDQIRNAENFGYVGFGNGAAERFNKDFNELYNIPSNAGRYDGKVAATDAYMKSNKMQLSNQDVVTLAERIKKHGGKTQWTESSPMYGDNSYDLSKFLNKIDINRVMRELERQNNPGGTQTFINSQAKGGKVKKRKCSCGCDLVLTKSKGGKLIETCACGCNANKNK